MGYDLRPFTGTIQVAAGGVQTYDLVAPAVGELFLVKKFSTHLLNTLGGSGSSSYTLTLKYIPAAGEAIILFGPTAYLHGGAQNEYRTWTYNNRSAFSTALDDLYKNLSDVVVGPGDKIVLDCTVAVSGGSGGAVAFNYHLFGAYKS